MADIVEPEVLIEASVRVNDWAAEYEGKYNKLYGIFEDIVAQLPNERSFRTFAVKAEGFRSDFNKMHQSMLDYAELLKNAANVYADQKRNWESSAGSL